MRKTSGMVPSPQVLNSAKGRHVSQIIRKREVCLQERDSSTVFMNGEASKHAGLGQMDRQGAQPPAPCPACWSASATGAVLPCVEQRNGGAQQALAASQVVLKGSQVLLHAQRGGGGQASGPHNLGQDLPARKGGRS